MTKEDFLNECSEKGVSEIVSVGNPYDDGVKVIFSDKTEAYILFRNEYGDAWMEYETGAHFKERWKNIKILTEEEAREYSKRALMAMKDKYSDENFKMLNEWLLKL